MCTTIKTENLEDSGSEEDSDEVCKTYFKNVISSLLKTFKQISNDTQNSWGYILFPSDHLQSFQIKENKINSKIKNHFVFVIAKLLLESRLGIIGKKYMSF